MLGYEKKTTPGRQNLMRHEPESQKRKLIQEESGAGIYSGDTVSTSSGHKMEHLPEAICELNVLEPSSVSARKHNTNIPIFWEEMITHTRNQTTFTITLTKILSMDEKGVQVRQYSDRLRLFVVYRSKERDIFYFG